MVRRVWESPVRSWRVLEGTKGLGGSGSVFEGVEGSGGYVRIRKGPVGSSRVLEGLGESWWSGGSGRVQ